MSKDSKCCGFTCPITGFNFCCTKGMVVGMVLMSVWSLVWGWIWHENVLSEAYANTSHLWRPMSEMADYMWCLNLGTVLIAVMFTYIFTKGRENKGWKEGLRYGLLITLLFAGVSIIMHAVMPISGSLAQMWIAGDAIQFIVGGIMLSWWFGRK